MLARCHSKSYIKFVNELSVSLEKEDKSVTAVPFTPAVKKDLMKSQKAKGGGGGLPMTPSIVGMKSLSGDGGLASPPGSLTKAKTKSDTTFTAGEIRIRGAIKMVIIINSNS